MDDDTCGTRSQPSESKPARTRRPHTRSRAGCVTCRKRHVKCDEARPICTNCKQSSRICDYTTTTLSLRDRRAQEKALPGALEVWSVKSARDSSPASFASSTGGSSSGHSPPALTWRNLGAGRGLDPFDTFAIPMQYKSRELLRYFFHTADAFGVAPKNVDEDCIALVMHNPTALRNTILLAGLHYAWNVGHLAAFEETHIVAKIDAIRSINKWISAGKPSALTDSVRQVATLSLVECCAGNVARAEAHLEGLVSILEAGQSTRAWESNLDNELVDRYFLLIYSFILGFKSRMDDVVTHDETFRNDPSSVTVEEAGAIMHVQHETELNGVNTRLKALRLFPHFFATPPASTEIKDVEVEPHLINLENVTRMEVRRRIARVTGEWNATWNMLWLEGGPTRMFYCFVDSHVKSISREPKDSPTAGKPPSIPSLRSSWVGLSAASNMYLHSVLILFNAEGATSGKLLVQVLTILMRDLDATKPVNERQARCRAGDLWIWKVMCGVFALYKMMHDNRYCTDDCLPLLESMWSQLVERMQYWSRINKASSWESVEPALQRIVWLCDARTRQIGRDIWQNSVCDER